MMLRYTTDDLIEVLNHRNFWKIPIDAVSAIISHLRAGDKLAIEVMNSHKKKELKKAVEQYKKSCAYPEEDIGEAP